jgi:hypothetical protein
MTPEEFEHALREATLSLSGAGFGPRGARVPDLRRALGQRVSRAEFDDAVRRLAESGALVLLPHSEPSVLSRSEAQDCVAATSGLLYLLRWVT